MYLSKKPLDLTVVYYTCNYLDEENPYFLKNTRKQLVKAIDEHPLIVVSHKPVSKEEFGAKNDYKNICLGDIGRSHRNIYKQILIGAKEAKTKYVATAEDDILYSYSHFHTMTPKRDVMLYDMNKLSLFTWTKPPMFSFRTKRMVVNQLIAPRDYLVDAMEERFARVPELKKMGWSDKRINSKWGDPGRYEDQLGVTVRRRDDFYGHDPSIVFTHPKAYGYETNHGHKKRLGDIRMMEIPIWGRAEDVLKLYYKDGEPRKE